MVDNFTKSCSELIKQIGLGVNVSKTYPKGHPSMQPIIQRVRILLKEVPIEKDSISLVVLEDKIMIGDKSFDAKGLPIVKSLAHRFSQIGVKSITFDISVTEADLKEFFNAMTAKPTEITDFGDITALVAARGLTGVRINKYRVGVVSTDRESAAVHLDHFLDLVFAGQQAMTDTERTAQLSGFLTKVGVAGSEPVNVQVSKILSGLEKLTILVADRYGEEKWDEFSKIFSRIFADLSPAVKKNIIMARTKNKMVAMLIKCLIPTMNDQDIVDIVAIIAKEKSPQVEQDIIGVLKNVDASRLSGILSSLRELVPGLDFERIVKRLMSQMKTVKDDKGTDKVPTKDLESEMRALFPRLRSESSKERTKAAGELLQFSEKIFASENYDLMKLLIDRFDTMADSEIDLMIFSKVVNALKKLYLRSKELGKTDLVGFISKKFGKHLLRKDISLLEKKKTVIKVISEVKDDNYVTELVSLLWDPGTFAAAREALIALSDHSVPLLIGSLMETDDRAIRMKIIDVLIKAGKAAVPELMKMLSAKEWYVRRNGVYILGEIKENSAVDGIGKLIDDPSEQVQLSVINSLNKIGGEKKKMYCAKGLDSEYRNVVIAAIKSLDKVDVKQKLLEVAQWIKSRKGIPDEKEENFRRKIVKVLGSHGDDAVIDTLVELLNEKPLFKSSILEPTKEAALNAIATIGSEKAIQVLKEAVNHKDKFVAAVAQNIITRIKPAT